MVQADFGVQVFPGVVPKDEWAVAWQGQSGGRVVIDTVLAAGPALIGIEVSGNRRVPAARTRGRRVLEGLRFRGCGHG